MLGQPVNAQGSGSWSSVGAPLGLRDEALSELRDELLVGGPIALLAVSLIGYSWPPARSGCRADARARKRNLDRHLAERLPVSPNARRDRRSVRRSRDARADRKLRKA